MGADCAGPADSAIGTVAVAPSDPNVVYVGTGHNGLGKGVFRSADAGATWQPAGLADTKYITGLLVDPRDANTVLVGVGSGGNFGSMVYYNNNPSPARGVYRTTDGGKTWTHALFVDAHEQGRRPRRGSAQPGLVYASLTGGGPRDLQVLRRRRDVGADGAPRAAAKRRDGQPRGRAGIREAVGCARSSAALAAASFDPMTAARRGR